MSLTGWPFLAFLVLLALVPMGLIVRHRRRWHDGRHSRKILVTWVVLAQLLAMLPAAALVNDAFGFYSSWTDLTGAARHVADPHHRKESALEVEAIAALRSAGPGHGALVHDVIITPTTGLYTDAMIYYPAAYLTDRRARFPVIEMLHGYPGTYRSFTQLLNIVSVLDTEIASHRIAPTLAVIPDIEVAPPRDTECEDVPNGPAVETLLGPTLHQAILEQVRARRERSAWGTLGYSTGGFCAALLALHHQDLYSAAVVMSGYFNALQDVTTGDLYGSQQRRLYDSPLWFIHHEPIRYPLSMLLSTGAKEPDTIKQIRSFIATPVDGLRIDTAKSRTGGHSFRTFRLLMPTCLDWLSSRLSGPLLPPPRSADLRSPSLAPPPPGQVVPTPVSRSSPSI